MRFSALKRVLADADAAPHDYRPSLQLFPTIDPEKLVKQLDIQNLARDRGLKNLPASDDIVRDAVELKIIERMEDENKSALVQFEDEIDVYHSRLSSLNFTGRFEQVRTASATSTADFEAEARQGINDLHGLRDTLREAEEERRTFRQKHKISRAARINTTLNLTLKIGLLGLLVVVETALNGLFLADGSAFGLVGGIVEASIFAILNIVTALLLAIYAARLLHHRLYIAKLMGLLVLLIYLATVGGINLALAHYREVSSIVLEDAGLQVVARLASSPLELTDIKSWMLFSIGALFSVFAFMDGWFLFDPYFGFAGVQKRLEIARRNYAEKCSENIERLSELRDELSEDVNQASRDLTERGREHDIIISSRARLIALLSGHQDQLDRTANLLLSKYREANTEIRDTSPPKYFTEEFNVTRQSTPPLIGGAWNTTELDEEIRKIQGELAIHIAEVNTAFQHAFERYKTLDDLFQDT
ncbi:MAG: hypothetical protein JKY10_05130 [Cohaesibacteraceae bacterium]|nr:hypothetical protein [Cohaesibacteraceae bacterium]